MPLLPSVPCAWRRRVMLAAVASVVSTPALAFAQQASYPSRAISMIVPWPPGGQTDLTMRVLCDIAAGLLGQPVIIENRPGAAGTLVAPLLKMAQPDGYTLGQLPLTIYRAALQRKVPWDPLRDILPIIQISGVTFGVVVPAASPFRSFGDILAWGREHPGELTVGSTGVGTTAHLAMEDVLSREGVRYIHVPYKGTADQMLAVTNGTLMVGVNSNGFTPYVENGKLRLLAVFNAQRSPRWPDVPTLGELGHPEAVYTSPYGIGAPVGVEADIVRKLHDAFRTALFDPRHLQELARYEQEPEYLSTEDYGRFVRAASAHERELLARLGLAGRVE